MTHAKRVIIGGGIGGISAALCRRRRDSRCMSSCNPSEFAEIGAGIQLAPNALRILDGLGLLSEINNATARTLFASFLRESTGIGEACSVYPETQMSSSHKYLPVISGGQREP